MISTDHSAAFMPLVPRLLISVQNAAEAAAAASGGADIIDIKDPGQGSLGRASKAVIADICQALRRQRQFTGPISAAWGELQSMPPISELAASLSSLSWVKVGLSDCQSVDWQAPWRQLQRDVRSGAESRLLAVVYVDHQACRAPLPETVLEEALATDTPGVLFDTYEKNGRSLFDYLPPHVLKLTIRELQLKNRFVALAGSLSRQHLPELAAMQPNIVAIRSGVCVGGRTGRVDANKVAAFRSALRLAVE